MVDVFIGPEEPDYYRFPERVVAEAFRRPIGEHTIDGYRVVKDKKSVTITQDHPVGSPQSDIIEVAIFPNKPESREALSKAAHTLERGGPSEGNPGAAISLQMQRVDPKKPDYTLIHAQYHYKRRSGDERVFDKRVERDISGARAKGLSAAIQQATLHGRPLRIYGKSLKAEHTIGNDPQFEDEVRGVCRKLGVKVDTVGSKPDAGYHLHIKPQSARQHMHR